MKAINAIDAIDLIDLLRTNYASHSSRPAPIGNRQSKIGNHSGAA